MLAAYLQNRQKRFLRDLDVSQLLHALLAFFLFLEQLAFAGDVAAIAFREHVLAQRLDGGTGDDRAADGRLHRDFERSEEHTSELQSLAYLVCRLLLEKKKKKNMRSSRINVSRVA